MVVIDLTWEIVASNVISQPVGAIAELIAIVNIHKHRGFHKGHHFILMAMEMHGKPGHDMECFIKECVHIFHDRQLGGHLSLSFCIHFFKQHVNIVFQCVLASTIKKTIPLVGDVCFGYG